MDSYCTILSSIAPTNILTILNGEAKKANPLRTRLNAYQEFNREFWMQLAELLDDAGLNVELWAKFGDGVKG